VLPALPLDEAGVYVAAAYLIFLALIVVYVGILAAKIARIEREVGNLNLLADEALARPGPDRPNDDEPLARPEALR
jgi:hypothetical protein